ncbi:MAG: sulfotransferase [Desulfobacteraceae bacterium]|nr:sulfotransferase [Desulfobacteraceae bacterium]
MGNLLLRPVVITGAKRSGTTLLQTLLDTTPGIFNLLDESYLLEYVHDLGEENLETFLQLFKQLSTEQLFEAVKKRDLFHFFEQGYTFKGTVNKQHIEVKYDFKAMFQELELSQGQYDNTIQSLWRNWTKAIMKSLNKGKTQFEIGLFKSPDYGKSAVEVFKHFDDPRVFIVVRHPCYAIDSLKRSRQIRKEKELNLFELFNVINDHKFLLSVVKDLTATDNKSKIKVIKYENFVADYQNQMRDIAEFIGVSFDKKMLEPTFNGSSWGGAGSFHTHESVSTKSTERKIETLTEWEQDFVNKELIEFNSYFGY